MTPAEAVDPSSFWADPALVEEIAAVFRRARARRLAREAQATAQVTPEPTSA